MLADGLGSSGIHDDFDFDILAFPTASTQAVRAFAAHLMDGVATGTESFQIGHQAGFEFIFGDDSEEDEVDGLHGSEIEEEFGEGVIDRNSENDVEGKCNRK